MYNNNEYILSVISFFFVKKVKMPEGIPLPTKKNSRPQAEAAVWIIRRTDINSSLA